jgi:antitoxin CptB
MNLLAKKIFSSHSVIRKSLILQCKTEDPSILKKLLYRVSKRGMRETEEILGRFFIKESKGFTDEDIKDFGAFLDEPDPDILKWIIIDKSLPDKYKQTEIVKKLKDYWCDCANDQSK